MSGSSTSFKQFRRCDICHINHNELRHIYANGHKKNVAKIMKKYGEKIRAAKATLRCPCMEEKCGESSATFWCYFCGAECEKHEAVGRLTVLHSRLLSHLTSDVHWTHTAVFWTENRLPKAKRELFLLLKEDLFYFKKMVKDVTEKMLAVQNQKLLQEAQRIRMQSMECSRVAGCHPTPSTATQASIAVHHSVSSASCNGVSAQMRTISAKGDGLTCLKIKDSGDSAGNVFSEVVPPWMSVETATGDSDVIGPTITDYDQQLQRERKKLPAERVGHLFKRGFSDANWMPDFGGVWSKSRRSHTRSSSRGGGMGTLKTRGGGVGQRTAAKETPQFSCAPYRRVCSVASVAENGYRSEEASGSSDRDARSGHYLARDGLHSRVTQNNGFVSWQNGTDSKHNTHTGYTGHNTGNSTVSARCHSMVHHNNLKTVVTKYDDVSSDRIAISLDL